MQFGDGVGRVLGVEVDDDCVDHALEIVTFLVLWFSGRGVDSVVLGSMFGKWRWEESIGRPKEALGRTLGQCAGRKESLLLK